MGTATKCLELCLIGLAAYSFLYPWLTRKNTGEQGDTTMALIDAPIAGLILVYFLWLIIGMLSGDVGLVNFRAWTGVIWIIAFVINLAYAHRRSVRRATALN